MISQIHVDLPAMNASSYPIWIDTNLLNNVSLWMPKNVSMVVIITDNWVKMHYATPLEKNLNQAGYKTLLLSFPAGEAFKTNETKCQLEEKMFPHGCDRKTLILAVGGGVVGDLAGFIAATYMRGIAYIQVPTTLLAMVDSSVGGKTAIDTPQGKNLIGAFWQPKAVVTDINCLKTLPQNQLVNGLVEVIKIFLTNNVDHLIDLEQHLEQILNVEAEALSQLITRAASIKADVVKHDEKENHQRVILNFGHTIGHALEQLSHYQFLHGYAVGLGILVEGKIAQLMGFLEDKHYEYIKALLNRLSINAADLKGFNIDSVLHRTRLDKKSHSNHVYYVLINGLGSVLERDHCFAHSVADEVVKRAFIETIEG